MHSGDSDQLGVITVMATLPEEITLQGLWSQEIKTENAYFCFKEI